MILGAYYLLWMLQRVLFGPLHEPHAHAAVDGRPGRHADASHEAAVRPVGWHEIAGLTPLMVLIVVIGVYPRPVLRSDPPVGRADRGPGRGVEATPADRPAGLAPARGRALPESLHRHRRERTLMPTDALDVTRQTLLILLPELLILLTATVMMTAGAFVRLPRRTWCAIAAGALVAALLALIALRHQTTDLYSAVALNDAFSGYARLGLLLSALILLAMAHDQVDDARAAEFFGALLMIHAGSMLVASANELVFLFVGPGAGQHPDLPAALPVAARRRARRRRRPSTSS